MTDKIQTTWMWQDSATNGVKGVIVDLDDQEIQWFDEPGCACGDTGNVQSIADFLNKGANHSAPADVLEEMHTEMTRYMGQMEQ